MKELIKHNVVFMPVESETKLQVVSNHHVVDGKYNHYVMPKENVYILSEEELLELKKKWCGEAWDASSRLYFDFTARHPNKEQHINNLTLE